MRNRRLFSDLFLSIFLLLIAMYILTPRYWEPGGESWKHWAAARILRDTGGFPVFTHGPLYIAYLQIFSILKYPFSMQLEFLVTHLFTYIAIFFMLRNVLPKAIALLLTCAWIPALSTAEGGSTIAGMGCLAIYLSRKYTDGIKYSEYFPASLVAAALCHSVYIFFLIGNCLGVFKQRLNLKIPLISFSYKSNKKPAFNTRWKIFLFALILLTIFLPSKRWDHNHMLSDRKYAPVSLSNPLNVAFFHIGNWKYILRAIPEDKLIYQDWYFTKDKAFGKSTTIIQAFFNRPDTVLKNISENIPYIVRLPQDFISGNFHSPFMAIAVVFLLLGLLGMINRLFEKGLLPVIFSVFAGSSSIITVLLLTWFNPRYNIVLLPVALFILIHTGYGVRYLSSLLFKINVVTPEKNAKSNIRKKIILFGSCLVIIGIISNEWVIRTLLPANYAISFSARLKILFVNLIFIFSGIFLLIYVFYKPKYITKILSVLSLSDNHHFNSIVAAASACCILLSTPFIRGRSAQFKAVLHNQGFLSGASPLSMVTAYPKLMGSIDNKSNILALEDVWIKGFTNVELNRIYHVFSLPPFSDSLGSVQKKLNNLDVIWVSYNWSNPEASVSTQSYLRYALHVAPFLEEMLKKGWVVQEVGGFGKIYMRPIKK